MNTKRSPIVTVLGHVDHGKTSLLDAIRKTNVASREAGGITQSIGASQITTKFGPVTFIDTPGHAAFTQMRSRGAKVADIAILVVSADDGVMPQTREALTIIRAADIPFIVAITKVDVQTANVERVKGQLESEGVLFEGRGGDTPSVEVSSKVGTGIEQLLELIGLISDMREISADPDGVLEAVVIETNKDKEGVIASVVVRNGTLRVGDTIACGEEETRARGLFDDTRKSVKAILPGAACAILGFSTLPSVGAYVYRPSEGKPADSSKEVQKTMGSEKTAKVKIILKTATKGSLEALLPILPEGVYVHEASVGDVTEQDIFLARTAGGRVVTFESKTPNSIKKLAENDHVTIHPFNIIYELVSFVDELVHAGDLVIIGKADVLAIFPYEDKKVAGVRISWGKISVKDTLILSRGKEEIGRVKVTSIRKLKDQLTEAREGQECGIIFEPQREFQVRDTLTAIKI